MADVATDTANRRRHVVTRVRPQARIAAVQYRGRAAAREGRRRNSIVMTTEAMIAERRSLGRDLCRVFGVCLGIRCRPII